jgi:tetratricopeptide (TPR) repeat protein
VADIDIKILESGWPFVPDTVVNKYQFAYLPKSYEDSVAFRCSTIKGVHIEDEHVNLAIHYAKLGNNLKAFNEYYSLIKSYPYVATLYIDATDYLLAEKDYKRAKDLLLSMPDRDSSYLALLRLGQIYAELKMPERAILNFQNARKVTKPNDNLEPLLIGLYKSYKSIGNVEKEKQILSEIRRINPKFNADREKSEVIPGEVKELITQAMNYAKEGNMDKALDALYKSIKVKETGFANQMIGSIFFQKKDMRALDYYEKAYSFNPQDPNVLNNLFILYLMKKDFAKASKCLEEFKQVSTDYDKIQRLNKLLENTINQPQQN